MTNLAVECLKDGIGLKHFCEATLRKVAVRRASFVYLRHLNTCARNYLFPLDFQKMFHLHDLLLYTLKSLLISVEP